MNEKVALGWVLMIVAICIILNVLLQGIKRSLKPPVGFQDLIPVGTHVTMKYNGVPITGVVSDILYMGKNVIYEVEERPDFVSYWDEHSVSKL